MPSKNKNLQLSDDMLFLIKCCNIDKSEMNIEIIYRTIISHDSAIALIKLANQHGVLPLVYKTLKELDLDHPAYENLLIELKSSYAQIAHRNMLLSAELIRMMNLCKAHGIQALCFKGPTLACMIYSDITLRQFADLDILIDEEQRKKIEALLLDHGYKHVYAMTTAQDKVWYSHVKDMAFIHPDKDICVEVHWQLLDRDYPLALDIPRFWEKSKLISFKGNMLRTFGNEDLLIYLCIHGSKHLWERLGWIKDIDLMVRTQDIDWNVVNEYVTSRHFERMTYLGLHLARQLFGTPLPEHILAKMELEKKTEVLERSVFHNWEKPQGMLSSTVTMIKFFPKLSMKLQYLFKVIFKPSQKEYRFIDLTQNFYWVYYLIRPFLLLKKYLLKN